MTFSNITDIIIPEGNVIRIQNSLGDVLWEKQSAGEIPEWYPRSASVDWSQEVMQFLALGDGTVDLGYMDYSFDGSNWTNVRSSQTIHVSKYQVLYIKTGVSYYTLRNFTFDFYVRGNMALSFTSSYSFRGMFENNTHAIGAKYFIVNYLNSWGQYMFQNYFKNCTNLVTAPQLPATTLAQGCYQNMFSGCTSLTAAPPTLPATTLAQACYWQMFLNCTSLATPPALPATALADQCYVQCFQHCTNLETTPELNALTLTTQCYLSMFSDCSKIDYIKMLGINLNSSAV